MVDFCADRHDVITNFTVITNVVIQRVHCILIHLNTFYQRYLEVVDHPPLLLIAMLPPPSPPRVFNRIHTVVQQKF